MKKYTAAAAIGLLITLVIICILFLVMVLAFKNTGSGGFIWGDAFNKKDVESQVEQQINNIEGIRSKNVNEYKKIEQEF